MQTLTTVIGPLIDKEHSLCLKSTKSAEEWSIYVKGASELYALHIPKGNTLEEPILKGRKGGEPVSRIEMVHLTVAGAQQFRYQVWPIDKIHEWIEKFGLHSLIRPSSVKPKKSTQQVTESASKSELTIQGKSRQETGKQMDSTKAIAKQERAKEEEDEVENGGHEACGLRNIKQTAAMQTSSIQENAVHKETNKVNLAIKDETRKAKRKEKKQRIEPSEKTKARQPAAKDQTTRQVLTEEKMLGRKVASLERAAAQIIPFPSEVTKSRKVKILTSRNRVVVCKY
ncbi:uncharacterized protein KY384_003267 [Bacidia gigantensis]|uniref:uncharacterized protein n=1 Tax=Bacidia gigantensis TaxID=2732470 RepID=UPI001D037917|nr:uncharacterized protein KY384_003267 [Bacidia gigantensis]KAG8531636.1 hypothetical protein KY384_003267 [Bacidia gigantensis]